MENFCSRYRRLKVSLHIEVLAVFSRIFHLWRIFINRSIAIIETSFIVKHINSAQYVLVQGFLKRILVPPRFYLLFIYFLILWSLKWDLSTPIDDNNKIISHTKFLLIPINPPILEIRVLKPVVYLDSVISTICSNQMMMPVCSFNCFDPICFVWYFLVL